jgi:hypothetical protein
MRVANQAVSLCLFAVVTFASLSALVRAQERTEITINDTGVQREPDVESGWFGVLRQHRERYDLPCRPRRVTKPDGSAGTIVPIETSMALNRPDGLRTVGPQTLIQAEARDASPN